MGKLKILKITCFSQLRLINYMTSSEAKMSHPNAIMLGVRASAYEFGEDMNMQFKAQLKCPEINKWLDQLCQIHTVGYKLVTKSNEG